MAGTDGRRLLPGGGPVIILVEPQLPENVGSAARAMLNFGLTRLRLVAPRHPWPHPRARDLASGAVGVLDGASVHGTLAEAAGDVRRLYAATARERGQAKPVLGPDAAMTEAAASLTSGVETAVAFGRERWGLTNDEVGLADAVMTFPVNPGFASLNLAQAVLLTGYEWFRAVHGAALPFGEALRDPPPPKAALESFYAFAERELDRVGFLHPPDKRETMLLNLKNMLQRVASTNGDLRALRGAMVALARGRRGVKVE